jgi:hypothetical protein
MFHLVASLSLPAHILESPIHFLTFDLAALAPPDPAPPSALRLAARRMAASLDLFERPEPSTCETFISWIADSARAFISPRGLTLFDLSLESRLSGEPAGLTAWADAGFSPPRAEGEPPQSAECSAWLGQGMADFAASLALPPHSLGRQEAADPRYPSELFFELSRAFMAGQERDLLSRLSPQAPRSARRKL